jgi:hypothetical protein
MIPSFFINDKKTQELKKYMAFLQKFSFYNFIRNNPRLFSACRWKKIVIAVASNISLLFILFLPFINCAKYTPPMDEIDQPFGYLLYNYLVYDYLITTEGWNVVTLTNETSTQMDSIAYSNGRLIAAGTVSYEIDLSTGVKIPWLNGTTVNSAKQSKDSLYALTTKYLSKVGNTTTSTYCPKPSELSLTGNGYLQRGEKIAISDAGDIYIGFKNQISTQAYSTFESTPNFDCSIYKLNANSSAPQTSCTKTNTSDMTLFAGTPGSCYFRDGALKSSYFRDIVDLTYDSSRNTIYVCETQAIRKIDIDKNQVTTLVGGMGNNGSIADGDRSSARLVAVGGCFYKNDFIYFTDRSSVRRLNINTNRVTTLADGKNRNGIFTPRDGKGGGVIVSQPGAITGDEDGNLYFLDRVNLYNNECNKKVGNYIRKISPPDKAISKLNIVSRGTSVQDVSVCYSQIKLALYLDGQNITRDNPIVFPTIALNSSISKTFEIKNIGEYYISLQKNPLLEYMNPLGSFTTGNIIPSEIPPGGSGFFTITFTPSLFGNNAYLSLLDYLNGYYQFGCPIRGNGF